MIGFAINVTVFVLYRTGFSNLSSNSRSWALIGVPLLNQHNNTITLQHYKWLTFACSKVSLDKILLRANCVSEKWLKEVDRFTDAQLNTYCRHSSSCHKKASHSWRGGEGGISKKSNPLVNLFTVT